MIAKAHQILTKLFDFIVGDWGTNAIPPLRTLHGVQVSTRFPNSHHLPHIPLRSILLCYRLIELLHLFNLWDSSRPEVLFKEINTIHSRLSLHQARGGKVWRPGARDAATSRHWKRLNGLRNFPKAISSMSNLKLPSSPLRLIPLWYKLEISKRVIDN